MLNLTAERAVTDLAEGVLSVRQLAGLLASPIPVDSSGDAVRPVLDRVTARLDGPAFDPGSAARSPDRCPFAQVVSERLDLERLAPTLSRVLADDFGEVDRLVDAAAAADFDSVCRRAVVPGTDGASIRAYSAGSPAAPPLVISSACGMPARLAEPWIRYFSADHFVITWESRGLFDDPDEFVGRTDLGAQVDDLFAVMDHFDATAAHIAGFCGGAVVALAAAARQPDRVTSLSLWHGDFDLGPDTPKTDHQRNLQGLMAMATRTRVSASGVHAVLCQSMVDSVPPDLAHLVLYPYATPEVLLRYCQLNGALMGADVRPHLAEATQPVLVVTSEDDETAHPDGSRLVAAGLSDARLHVYPHGDHISLFRGAPELLATAADFVAEHDPPRSRSG